MKKLLNWKIWIISILTNFIFIGLKLKSTLIISSFIKIESHVSESLNICATVGSPLPPVYKYYVGWPVAIFENWMTCGLGGLNLSLPGLFIDLFLFYILFYFLFSIFKRKKPNDIR